MGGTRSGRASVRLMRAVLAMAAAANLLSGCALLGGGLSDEEKRLDPRYRAVLEAQKARAGAPPSGTQKGDETFEEKITRGDRQRGSGQDEEALFAYLSALRMKPDDPVPRERIGLLHLREDPERSEAIFRGLLRKEPDSVPALTGLGLALFAQDRPEEARTPLERAVEIEPGSAMALSALGVVCDRLGDPASGTRYQRLALERRPGDPSLLNNLGASCLLDGDLECAEATFREALLLDPQDPTLHNNLGLALARQRRYSDALAAFRKGGSEQAALNNVGWAHYLNGEYDAAVTRYEQALLVPGDEALTVQVLDNLKTALAARGRATAPAAGEPAAPAPTVELPLPAAAQGAIVPDPALVPELPAQSPANAPTTP